MEPFSHMFINLRNVFSLVTFHRNRRPNHGKQLTFSRERNIELENALTVALSKHFHYRVQPCGWKRNVSLAADLCGARTRQNRGLMPITISKLYLQIALSECA
jgi:hypothetical protein